MERLTKFVIIALSLTILSLFIPSSHLCDSKAIIGFPIPAFFTSIGYTCMLILGNFTLNPLFYFFIGPSIVLNSSFIICKLVQIFYKKKFNFKKIFLSTVLIISIVMVIVIINSPISSTLIVNYYDHGASLSYVFNPDLFPNNLMLKIGNHFLFSDNINFNCTEKPLSISQMCNSIDYEGNVVYKISTSLLSSYFGLEPNIVKIDESIGSKMDPVLFKKLIDLSDEGTKDFFR